MCAEHGEVVRLVGASERLLPTRDPIGERAVDILKGLLGGGARGGVAGLSQTVEHAARVDGLFRFKGQEGKLETGGFVVRVEAQRTFELVARGGVFTGA
jgi:hypothetical protein